ncbi:MAG: N-carbamoylputrescine amidase [Halieaceae bacterium]|nr:N-carbamoylputrescine amidase [Halieaceae bacterium]
MREVSVAATQMACSWDRDANVARAEALVREAAQQGAQIVLIQELFETPYFCIEQRHEHLQLATERDSSPLLQHFQALARELAVVLPISWFEKAGNAYFNSMCIIDADGSVLGYYRKSHIPNAIGYQEKQYFTPGDTGFQVWDTRYARIGVAICWDQWFPEAARCMTLNGAELLFYPTAIGSEPGEPDLDSREHWKRVMQGHAAANVIPVVASNRIGEEIATGDESLSMTFYGNSFISDYTGELVQLADDHSETVLVQSFDLDAIAAYRASWGLFRDRRPDLYGDITTHTPGVS